MTVSTVVKGDMPVLGITCTKLKAKYKHPYSSFYGQVDVYSRDLKQATELFLSPYSWPDGVFIEHFFTTQQQDGSYNTNSVSAKSCVLELGILNEMDDSEQFFYLCAHFIVDLLKIASQK